jgi:hypothetical protein
MAAVPAGRAASGLDKDYLVVHLAIITLGHLLVISRPRCREALLGTVQAIMRPQAQNGVLGGIGLTPNGSGRGGERREVIVEHR